MIEVSQRWIERYPGAVIGVLVVKEARTSGPSTGLETLREAVEADIRARFAGGKEALKGDAVLAAYAAYYRCFKKTYHVALQLESVATKGRRISSPNALVQAMVMAELRNCLLTAGHDLARVQTPVRVDVAAAGERYVSIGGAERVAAEGDMRISDTQGVLSSIIYGPDARTAIGPDTDSALFTVYAPAGIGAERVRTHLDDLARFVAAAAPGAVVETPVLVTAG